MSGSKSPPGLKDSQLPLYRVKTIMKSSPDVENVGQESLYLVARATEYFIQQLALEAYEHDFSRNVQYKDLAEVVQKTDNLAFLREILPKKITVKEYREIMESKSRNNEDIRDIMRMRKISRC